MRRIEERSEGGNAAGFSRGNGKTCGEDDCGEGELEAGLQVTL